jgi:AraC-like DNA-binding protein
MDYRIDLFAIFIFLGIVQAVFLCVFFFTGENRKVNANIFYGLFLLSITLCLVEIFLMYTGYIVHCLYLVDFSEPAGFVIGPSFYLLVVSLISGRVGKKYYWHFAFPAIYLLLLIPFFMAPEEVKYNSWIYAYKPGLAFMESSYHSGEPRLFWVTNHPTELILLSLGIYAILSLLKIISAFNEKKESLWRSSNMVLIKLRTILLHLLASFILIVIIKLLNENDTGDHVFAAFISVIVYLTSFQVIKQSGFFRQPSLADPLKYRTSSVTPEVHGNLLQKLKMVMETDKPFLNSGFSLPDLAQRLNTTVHILSQVINEGLGKNFFEMTATYRVEEAKRLLMAQKNIKVEEIADQVGYSSKSSFNNAFKRITGKTPSEFRAENY